MRIILSGGGTAGHITPALAIADTIQAAYPDAKICFFGGEHGLERELVTKAGYDFVGFQIEGLHRSLSLKNLRVLYRAMQALKLAKQRISLCGPDLVIGTGGYVCWPILKAASALGIPTALHESNAVLGLAAKQLVKKMLKMDARGIEPLASTMQMLRSTTELCTQHIEQIILL